MNNNENTNRNDCDDDNNSILMNNLQNKVSIGCRHTNSMNSKHDKLKYLSNYDKLILRHLHSEYGNGIKLVHLMNNHGHKMFGGNVQILKPNSKISPAYTIPNDCFGVFMMLRIRNDKLNTNMIRNNLKHQLIKLLENTMNRYKAATIATHSNGFYDKAKWSPKLNGGHISIYELSIPNKRVFYFLGVKSSVGRKISAELRSIASEKDMTAEKFYNDPRVNWAKNYSQRNAKKLLTIASSILESQENKKHIEYSIDHSNFQSKHELPIKLAEPDIASSYNTIDIIKNKNTEVKQLDGVAFFNDCSNGSDNKFSAIVESGSLNPVYEFPGKSENMGDSTFMHKGYITNGIYNSVPSSSSRRSQLQRKKLVSNVDGTVTGNIEPAVHSLNDHDIISNHYETHHPVDTNHIEKFSEIYGLDKNSKYNKYNPVFTILE